MRTIHYCLLFALLASVPLWAALPLMSSKVDEPREDVQRRELGAVVPGAGTSIPPSPREPSAEQTSGKTLPGDDFSGFSEPDPAHFDREGLENWWRHYQQMRDRK